MSKAGNFELCDVPLREKVVYEEFMQMNPKYKHYIAEPKQSANDANTDANLLSPSNHSDKH